MLFCSYMPLLSVLVLYVPLICSCFIVLFLFLFYCSALFLLLFYCSLPIILFLSDPLIYYYIIQYIIYTKTGSVDFNYLYKHPVLGVLVYILRNYNILYVPMRFYITGIPGLTAVSQSLSPFNLFHLCSSSYQLIFVFIWFPTVDHYIRQPATNCMSSSFLTAFHL